MSTDGHGQQVQDPEIEIEVEQHRSVDPYLRILSAAVRDDAIGWRALGLLAYMLNLPKGWVLRLSHLGKRRQGHGNGKAGTSAAIKELAVAGYLKIERKRAAGRISKTVWHVSDRPIFLGSPANSQSPPRSDFQDEEIHREENRPLSITGRASTTDLHAGTPHGGGSAAPPMPARPEIEGRGRFREPLHVAGVVCWYLDEPERVAMLVAQHGEGAVLEAAKKIAQGGQKPLLSYISKFLRDQKNGSNSNFIPHAGGQQHLDDPFERAAAESRERWAHK